MEQGKVSAYDYDRYINTPHNELPESLIKTFEEADIDFEVLEKRNQVIQKLSSLTGYDVVADFNAPKHVAGYVKTTGDKSIYISNETLDDPVFSEYVLKHESNHLDTMFFLPVEDNFSEDHNKIIETLTGHLFLQEDEDFFLEGFNDLKTKNEKSGNEKSGYSENIRAVEILNNCSQKILGSDKLMESFKKADIVNFAKNLQILSNRLLLFNQLTKVNESVFTDKELEPIETQNLINQKILTYSDEVLDEEDAKQIIYTWIEEIALEQEVKKIREDFGEPANDNQKSTNLLMVA